MSTQAHNNATVDADGSEHTLAADVTTVTADLASGTSWPPGCYLRLLMEDESSGGNFIQVPDWEMNGPGSKNVVANGSGGQKVKLRLVGITGTGSGIDAWFS